MEVAIFDYLTSRGVTRICHFTSTVNILHIIQSSDGILATDLIKGETKRQNDKLRCDNLLDYVNCSIEYPNYWYWRQIKDKDPIFRDWVILYISLDILKHRRAAGWHCR